MISVKLINNPIDILSDVSSGLIYNNIQSCSYKSFITIMHLN